jgi:hypothetical protein
MLPGPEAKPFTANCACPCPALLSLSSLNVHSSAAASESCESETIILKRKLEDGCVSVVQGHSNEAKHVKVRKRTFCSKVARKTAR